VRPLVRLLLNSTDGVAQVDQVTVETLPTGVVNTVNISDGAITTAKLTAGSVDATALSATAITGKTITGGTISGTTVTGGTIQTSATNPAMRITSSDNYLRFYNSAGVATVAIGGTNGSASLTGSLDTGLSTGARMHISADSFDGGSVEWKPDPTATQVNHNAQVYATYGSILDPNSGTTTIVSPDVTPTGFVGYGQPIINLSSFRDGTPTQLFARADMAQFDFPKGITLGSYAVAGHGHSPFTPETWQTPTYGSGWSAATAVGTLTPMPALRYRLGIEDTLILEGSFTAASTGTPVSAVVTLPTGYRPTANSAPFPVACRTSAGTVTTMWMYLSAAGNLNINSQTGSSVTLGATYSLPRTHISLGNIS
jgi:hypothetical protein